jgi:hypothetical protein
VITNYNHFLKLYEFHPGSEYPYDSILNRIKTAIDQGANITLLKYVIKEILNFYHGQDNTQKFGRQSEEFKYVSLISDAIETSRDDGYPDDWIFSDLEKIYHYLK